MTSRAARSAGYKTQVWIFEQDGKWYYGSQIGDAVRRKGLLHEDGRALVQMDDGNYFQLPTKPLPQPVDLVALVAARLEELGWSMAELDRRAGLAVGECRRFLSRERSITHHKVENLLAALGLTVTEKS